VKQLALALAMFAAQPADAHCFSRWFYPYPQRCVVARQMTRIVLHVVMPPERGISDRNQFLSDIPLPSLARADCDGGEADEATRGRLLLRAALEAP
jgi:hypothetical protein